MVGKLKTHSGRRVTDQSAFRGSLGRTPVRNLDQRRRSDLAGWWKDLDRLLRLPGSEANEWSFKSLDRCLYDFPFGCLWVCMCFIHSYI